jgi:hypothetical protein
VTLLLSLGAAPPLHAFTIDRDGDAKIGIRAYSALRVGTEAFDSGEFQDGSFPRTGAGNLRQHRFFLEVELNHKLTTLSKTTWGPAGLFGLARVLPIDRMAYNVTYRGEYEGIWEWGSEGFTTFRDYKLFEGPPDYSKLGPAFEGLAPDPADIFEYGKDTQSRAKRVSQSRHRLYQAYMDFEGGPVFVRIGRQNLSWGETDNFRLLDNINPLDNGFGGFFVDLDERRIPLDMLRMNVALPDIGPFSQAFVEGFGALGNRQSYSPGIPVGSPWNPGSLSAPNPLLRTQIRTPDLDDFRGGMRLVFNAIDTTFSVAHYWTYLDIPAVHLIAPANNDDPIFTGLTTLSNRVQAIQTAPVVPITGASASFALPSLYTIVRSEFAYFHGEAANCQGTGRPVDALQFIEDADPALERNLKCGLDPFLFPGYLTQTSLNGRGAIVGDFETRDSVNVALGFDINRYLRWLNPGQTFFISTQVFYKHIIDALDDQVLPVIVRRLPLDVDNVAPDGRSAVFPLNLLLENEPLEPRLAKVQQNQVLHTLRIQTSYRGGTIQPLVTVFYDWVGVWFVQPGIRVVRDPFRFVVDYTAIEGVLGGQVGLLRDRDNVRFQVEMAF